MNQYTMTALWTALLIGGLILYYSRRKPNSIIQTLNSIMATLAELNTKIDELQSTIDTEQEQIAAALAKLQETIEELRLNQNDPAAIDAAIAKLESAKADLEGTVTPDVEETPE